MEWYYSGSFISFFSFNSFLSQSFRLSWTFHSPLFWRTCVCLPIVTCDPFCALLAYFLGFHFVTVMSEIDIIVFPIRVQRWAP